MCFFGNIAEDATKSDHILTDILAFEEDASLVGLEQAGNDLNGCGFPRSVGSEVTDDFPCPDTKVDVLNRRNSPISLAKVVHLEHGALRTDPTPTYVAIYLENCQVVCYIDIMRAWQANLNSRTRRR